MVRDQQNELLGSASLGSIWEIREIRGSGRKRGGKGGPGREFILTMANDRHELSSNETLKLSRTEKQGTL